MIIILSSWPVTDDAAVGVNDGPDDVPTDADVSGDIPVKPVEAICGAVAVGAM